MSHSCKTCKQRLIPVHPSEVKRAILILSKLARNPRAHHNVKTYHMLEWAMEGLEKAARYEAALEIEPDLTKWKGDFTKAEYRLAAQKLSDMWLPIGYVLDPNKQLHCPGTCAEKLVPDPEGNVTCTNTGRKRYRYEQIPMEERVHVDWCYKNPDYLKDYK